MARAERNALYLVFFDNSVLWCIFGRVGAVYLVLMVVWQYRHDCELCILNLNKLYASFRDHDVKCAFRLQLQK